jgi:diguanylate cyclase (GGDEF)-like protein
MTRDLWQRYLGVNLTTPAGRALVEEQYWSLRRQAPIVYVLCLVNLSAMEIAATSTLTVGLNVPTFIAACGLIRTWHWYGAPRASSPDLEQMAKRLRQAVWFAALVCLIVSVRCLYLLEVGDATTQMAVMLFGGLTAIGVSYGLTALAIAGWIPLALIIAPLSVVALLSHDRRFAGAAFGLVAAAVLTLRLLGARSRHFTTVIRSRSVIAREQDLVEHARQEAIVAATTDFLTSLPNRRALVAALDTAASEATEPFALAILDLNRFKAVNDTYGHALGDELLRAVAERLLRAVGRRGLVARLGGDEFGILLPDVRDAHDAKEMGREILHEVNGPASLNGREFAVATSCGIALWRKSKDSSPSRLMADADLALYEAKESPGGFATFELRMEAPRRRRAQIERALELPGMHDELRVVFQPIFNLRTGRIIANEALARWSNPELGAVSPSEFVPIAEQRHLIDDINCHLMGLAFAAARSWPAEIKLSFNLSAIQLCSKGAAKAVLRALERANLAAGRLQVEVTETALLADFACARANLSELKRSGATIVLDDFGAGYASIGYLRELSFDQIKLDGGLVTAAQHSVDGKRLLRAVIGLCECLGVSTVAEHVESSELLALVVKLGCTAGQGFWLERPLAHEDLLPLLDTKVIPLRSRHRSAA